MVNETFYEKLIISTDLQQLFNLDSATGEYQSHLHFSINVILSRSIMKIKGLIVNKPKYFENFAKMLLKLE